MKNPRNVITKGKKKGVPLFTNLNKFTAQKMQSFQNAIVKGMERYLEKELATAFKELLPVLIEDKWYLKMKPIEDLQKTLDLLGSLYVRYLKVVNTFIEVHNYLLNPLKRKCLKCVIERIFGRIVEVKQEMVDAEKADFQFLDNVILQNFITRKNVQLQIPLYFKDEREEILAQLNERIDKVMYRKEHSEEFIDHEESNEYLEKSIQESIISSRSSLVKRSTMIEPPTDLKEQKRVTLRTSLIAASLSKAAATAAKRPVFVKVERIFEFLEQIKLIQRHERARYGRLKTRRRKEEIKLQREKAFQIYMPIPEEEAVKATETLQNHYMSYKNRRWKKYLDIYKGITYGTLLPSYRDRSDINDISKLMEKRKKEQKDLKIEMAYKEDLIMEKMQNLKKYELMEDMATELRAFIRQWYDFTKEYGYTEVPEWPSDEDIIPPARVLGIPEGLPKYYINTTFPEMNYAKIGPAPTTTLGGSELITAGYWIPVEQYVIAAEMARTILAKGLPEEDAEKIAQEKELEKEREEQKKEEEKFKMEELMKRGHVPWKSIFLKELSALVGEFIQSWDVGKQYSFARDKANTEEQLKINATYRIIKEIRKDVDSQMRKELKILKAAIEKDNLNRVEPPKSKKKKPRERKKKAKKGKKDPLAKRTIESLFDDLAEEGLIIKCNPVDIDSLPGQYNFHAQEARMRYESPIPAIGDVYQVAKEYIVLPLACKTVKEHCASIKSVLLIGPDRQTHPLAHSLAYCIGALMFYLPALNFTKRFKPKILINMLLKVAKEFEPSIFFIDGAEKPFYKKAPRNEKPMRPGALRSFIPKLIKGIKAADRVMVIGVAEKPWLSKPKLASVFQKILICSESDYHCMSALVQNTIMANHGVDREFDTSVPSAMFMGCPLDEVENRLKSIFTVQRKIKLYFDPLKIEETGCIDKEPSKSTLLEDWYTKFYPLNKARKKTLDAEKERHERETKLKESVEKRKTLLNIKK